VTEPKGSPGSAGDPGGAAGLAFSLQKFSTEDGPGIRTTVFLKGCPLRCVWCHNPEGLRAKPDLMWFDVRCIGAQDCLASCAEDALALTAAGMRIDRRRCTLCGACVEVCPSAAFERIGTRWTPDQLLPELMKDLVFYQTSGGGVTFSGGEPLMQAAFLQAMLPRCKAAGLHVALDTCGAVPWDRLERLLPYLDLVLLDLKLLDEDRHLAATGVGNAIILENARRLARRSVAVWVRTPVIPGYTDDEDNILALAEFIRGEMPSVERWDLLAYTNLGRPKYHRLDLPYPLGDEPLLRRETIEALWELARAHVACVRWSGATRLPSASP
jgi:pyruvate formate lyase activating enzyme